MRSRSFSYWVLMSLFTIQLFFPFAFLNSEETKLFEFVFSKDNRHWVGDFADYPVGQEALLELEWAWTNLPAPFMLTSTSPLLTKGMFLSGINHSDNLFMFIKRQIRNLEPHTEYALTFLVTIENNVPPGQFGIGGSPGESVFFKVGGSTHEPKKEDVNGFFLLNVDKGFQSQNGKNALTVGNLANPLVDPNNPQYEPKQFLNENTLNVKSDQEGRLWVFVGTDSGFEGPTNYYIAQINLVAQPVKEGNHHHCNH